MAFCRQKNVRLPNFSEAAAVVNGREREAESGGEPFIDMGQLDGVEALPAEMAAAGPCDLVVTSDLGDGARPSIRPG